MGMKRGQDAQSRSRAKFHFAITRLSHRRCTGKPGWKRGGIGVTYQANLMMPPLADATATIAELKARVLAFARERDWEQFHSPKNLSMALAAEAGELMEHFLWADAAASRNRTREPARRRKIEEEIADVVIYSLEFANVTGIDLAAAIETKLAANAQKYPVEKARGRSEKYTEL
jgi:NTP pyrophosphatase (non-canonical NTP hydrolase)